MDDVLIPTFPKVEFVVSLLVQRSAIPAVPVSNLFTSSLNNCPRVLSRQLTRIAAMFRAYGDPRRPQPATYLRANC